MQILDAGSRKKDTYSFSLERSATDQLYFAGEQVVYQDEGYSNPYKKEFGIGHQEAELSNSWDATIRTLRSYLERLRVFHFNDTSINARIRSTASMADGRYLRSDGGNIAAFLYEMREDPADQPYYERIVRYVRMMLPQFFDFVLEPDMNGNLSLSWRQEGAEEVFGPHQFSGGALRFVALTTLLLQPSRTAPMTIILDEPEIGLHPYAISLLAKEIRMASRTSQIIVSTQSPLLLNEFSCEDIITAEYDSVNQKSILRRHKEVDLQEWLQDYTLGELWEQRFIPYIQLHEFEALLFSDIKVLEYDYMEPGDIVRIGRLYEDTKGVMPEDINHGEETAPSKRLFHAINYRKGESLWELLDMIGIPVIRKKCPHFSEWIDKLQGLPEI